MAPGCMLTDFLGLIKVTRGRKEGYVTALPLDSEKNLKMITGCTRDIQHLKLTQ